MTNEFEVKISRPSSHWGPEILWTSLQNKSKLYCHLWYASKKNDADIQNVFPKYVYAAVCAAN